MKKINTIQLKEGDTELVPDLYLGIYFCNGPNTLITNKKLVTLLMLRSVQMLLLL